jgi:biopolymer transport protein ExbD
MAVHPAGPQLFRTIPFNYIGRERKSGHSGAVSVNVSLNVVPFIDIMTILVCFLLMTFSASGELISAQRGLTLPNATNKDALKQAPVIVVTRDAITFQGDPMAQVQEIERDASMEWKIIELYDRLRQEKTAFKLSGYANLPDNERDYCENPRPDPEPHEICLDGLVILQADRDTTAKVLNRVIKTAYAAEYPNILFAVNPRMSRD